MLGLERECPLVFALVKDSSPWLYRKNANCLTPRSESDFEPTNPVSFRCWKELQSGWEPTDRRIFSILLVGEIIHPDKRFNALPVSYTHLTLPTN